MLKLPDHTSKGFDFGLQVCMAEQGFRPDAGFQYRGGYAGQQAASEDSAKMRALVGRDDLFRKEFRFTPTTGPLKAFATHETVMLPGNVYVFHVALFG